MGNPNQEKGPDLSRKGDETPEKVVDVNLGSRSEIAEDTADVLCSPDKKKCTTAVERKKMIEKNIRNLPKISEILDGIDQLDLAKLSVNTLVKLEDLYPGILLYTFTDIIGEAEKVDFDKWEFYKKPIAGQKLKVDFRGNESANMQLGAADFMPPSVRCISIESQGVTRTSERRIGLKGRNKTGNGFFDKDGYMAVYSGDCVVVGGANEADKNIDLNYEKPFLTKKADGSEVLDQEACEKYEKSDESVKDREFLEKLLKTNPRASRGKQLTTEEIAAIEARNTNSGLSGNIVNFALAVARDPYNLGLRNATCCYDWAKKIYKTAGAKTSFTRAYSYYGKYSGKNCGDKHATEEQYDMIKPGDWIFYNNHNTADTYGCHSALFIEWIDRDKKIARLASGSRGIPWHVHTKPVDFNKDPVTLLGKPSPAGGDLPDVAQVKQKFYEGRGFV